MSQFPEVLDVTARDTISVAVRFDGVLSDGLKDLLDDLDLAFVDDLEGTDEAGTRCFIDGNSPEDTVAIFPGYYFIQYGPFWDVLSAEEFHADFTIDIQ